MSDTLDQQVTQIAQLLIGKSAATDQAIKAAKQLIQMAEKTAPDAANWPSVAMTVLTTICGLRSKGAVGISEFTAILRFVLAAANFEGSLRFAKTSIEKSLADGLCNRTEDGQLEPTRQTRLVVARFKRVSNSKWDVDGLPEALRRLAQTLMKHGGQASSATLADEIKEQPSTVLTKYPAWSAWIKKHIGRPKHGFFTMKNLVKKR